MPSNCTNYRKLALDPVKNLTAITNLVNLPKILLNHPSVPIKDVNERIALAKQRPGELQYSSAGSGAQPHLPAKMFKSMTGVNLLQARYKGTGPQMIALIAREAAGALPNWCVVGWSLI